MTVAFVCSEYPPSPHGGIGVIVKSVAEQLVLRGASVIVVGYDPIVDADTTDEVNGVVVIRIADKYRDRRRYKVGRYYLTPDHFLRRSYLSSRLEEVVAKYTVKVVESYDWSGPLWRKPSVPLIVRMHGAHTSHNYYEGKRSSRLLHFFERRNLKMADHLTAVSRHIGDLTLKSVGLDRPYTVIYNGVDTGKFFPRSDLVADKSRLLYVGRVVPRKGLAELFKAVNYIFEADDKAELHVVGPSSEEYAHTLLGLVAKDFSRRIHFLGKVAHEELPEMYQKASLVVMPSRAEAFGLTIVEAMACGAVVAAMDRASAPEIIDDAVDGFLIDYSNPKEASYRILEILHSKDHTNIKRRAREKIKQVFALEKIASQYVSFYKSILNDVR